MMNIDLELVATHELIHVPDTWDITSAVALGASCLARAQSAGLPILIQVRHIGRTVYLAGLPGSAPINDNWAMRKIRLVELFGKSSLLIRLENEKSGVSVYDKHSISEESYAAVGGAIVLRNSMGNIGVLAISGLDQVSDHMFCVDALSEFAR
jgi:uncharacterized protein (UPF0303 family)